MTPDIATRLGLNAVEGAIVTSVEAGSPADRAGLRRGFVIYGVGESRITDVTVLARLLHGRKTGDRVQLSLFTPRPLRRAVAEVRIR